MKTILVVDDEYALVESLVELLQDEGYRAVSAANGLDALDRLREAKPDLILTDNMMPIADGKEFVSAVRGLDEYRATPVVMMSSAPKEVSLAPGPKGAVEASAFLAKPFSLENLLELVEELIGKGDGGGAETRH
jgi:CheY-like chemotaxis protein